MMLQDQRQGELESGQHSSLLASHLQDSKDWLLIDG